MNKKTSLESGGYVPPITTTITQSEGVDVERTNSQRCTYIVQYKNNNKKGRRKSRRLGRKKSRRYKKQQKVGWKYISQKKSS